MSEFTPALNDTDLPLYPPLESVREISRKVAVAVGVEAQQATTAVAASRLATAQRHRSGTPPSRKL